MSLNTVFGFNLRVLSFQLPRSILKESDDVRVSVTTIPEENKQAFTISARKMKDTQLTFRVNVNILQEELPNDFISTATEKIVVVFRKRTFFGGDPIIASTIIYAKDFPKNLSEPAKTQTIDIYEPKKNLEKSIKDNDRFFINDNVVQNRRVIGRLDVQMSLTDPIQLKEFDDDQMEDLNNNNSIFGKCTNMNDDYKYEYRYNGFSMLRKNKN